MVANTDSESDSDSDSDDSIILQSAFTRKSTRKETAAKREKDNYLDEMVKARMQDREQDFELQKLKAESKKDDELRKERHEKRPVAEEPIETESRSDFLGEINSIQRSIPLCPTQQTLYKYKPHFPKTHQHAIESLIHQLSAVSLDAQSRDFLLKHLTNGSFDLSRRTFRSALTKACTVPRCMWQWLVMMTCHPTLYKLSNGSYLLLKELLDIPSPTLIFTLEDMKRHLKFFFGICVGEKGRDLEILNDSNDSHSAFEMQGGECFSRWLHIMDKAFVRSLVYTSNDRIEIYCEVIAILVKAGIDPMVQSARSSLRQTLSHLLGNANACTTEKDKEVASQFFALLPQILRKESRNWFFDYSMTLLLLAAPSDDVPTEWSIRICQMIAKDAVEIDDSDGTLQTIYVRWNLSDSMATKAYAYTHLILQSMKPLVIKGENGPLCLVLLQLAVVCLSIASHEVQIHHEENTLKKMFQDLFLLTTELADKTAPYILSQIEFQRLKYYLLCLKQFARLETDLTKQVDIGQKTIDNFFTTAAK